MASNVKQIEQRLSGIVEGLITEYDKAKGLYDKAGLNAELKESSLTTMANVLQFQTVAIQNYANWKHILREDFKVSKK